MPLTRKKQCHMALKWIGLLSFVGTLVYFFGFFKMARGEGYDSSIAAWAFGNWYSATNMSHGLMVIPLMIAMFYIKKEDIHAAFKNTVGTPFKHNFALLGLLIGSILYALAFRTIQPRLAMAALPFFLWSAAWFLWGWHVARATLFPLFFFWIAIPMPSFQNATSGLQQIASQIAEVLSAIAGVDTIRQGADIYAANGSWGPFNITGGCSGIRSLFSLIMLGAAYAYITSLTFWRGTLFILLCIPIAIIGNAFRVSSICIVAEYGNPEFAATTWHDWSGLIVFFPLSIGLLLLVHKALDRQGKQHHQTVIQTQKQTHQESARSHIRYLILALVVFGCFLPALLLPKQHTLMPSALKQQAPDFIGSWQGHSFRESEEERKILAKNTIFVKKLYTRASPQLNHKTQAITCSMIFSGHDVINSLHKPEICLPAQGHYDMQSSSLELNMPLREINIPIQRIRSKVLYNPVATQDSPVIQMLTYYLFVGHSTITNRHQKRTVLDIKDRLLKGYDQSWAFILLTIPFGEHPDKQIDPLSEQEADAILSQFCIDLVDRSINWEMIQQ